MIFHFFLITFIISSVSFAGCTENLPTNTSPDKSLHASTTPRLQIAITAVTTLPDRPGPPSTRNIPPKKNESPIISDTEALSIAENYFETHGLPDISSFCIYPDSDNPSEWYDYGLVYEFHARRSKYLHGPVVNNVTTSFEWIDSATIFINASNGQIMGTPYIRVINDSALSANRNKTPSKYSAISSGFPQNLALREDGTVVAWGYNGNIEPLLVPENLTDVSSISAGDQYSLALKRDGTIVFWGMPDHFEEIPALANTSEMHDARSISAGGAYALVLKKDGTVVTKGSTDCGVLNVPKDLTNVKMVSAGDVHSLALKNDGTVIGWGGEDCGYSSFGQGSVPAGLNEVVAISAGMLHSLALKKDGTVVAWGDNENGQTDVPANLTNVVAISAGDRHSLALKKDGTVAAWGDNKNDQCDVPQNLGDVIAISAGGQQSLALKKDGTLVAWGWKEEYG
jgi:alpha-tubulin suppressor-like RCC1 family protein